MLLRAGKVQEAADLATAFLANPAASASRYRPLALYQLGYAKFAQGDYLAAGRALSRLAPFYQEFGTHARYLLGRTHHLSGERTEAGIQYKAVLVDYEEQKKAAQETLKNPAALQPAQKDYLEGLARNPPPDYLSRAVFYSGLLLAEEGKFPEALERFATLVQQFPKSPMVPDAQLRLGYCQMQLRVYAEAAKALQPLAEHPQLGDQALWWLARCQVGAADPNNAAAFDLALRAAMDTFRRAADRAGQMAPRDPDAKGRRGDMLLELADTQMLAKMHREAAAAYQQALGENNNPDRAEEAMQRQATALHLAGQFRESDEICKGFEQKFPKSTLLPAIAFRTAENAYLAAAAAAGRPDAPSREEANKLFAQAITRYQRLLKQFPDFPYVGLARQGLGSSYYRLGQYADAIPVLTAIPESERIGELITVPYLLADCLIRTLPPEADDAIGAGRLVGQAEQAAKLLEGFLAATQGKAPQAPDAHLKLASCYQLMGALLADPPERQKVLTSAREICEKFIQQFPHDPALPMIVFERAKVLALLGDLGNATNELRRFRQDPLRGAPIAPLACVRLSALLRAQNNPAESAAVMAECRQVAEAGLQKDPGRAGWVPSMQYEHALALREAGKIAEARGIFEGIAKQFPNQPDAANAQWRVAQGQREELIAAVAAAKATVARPGAKPEEIQAAKTALDEAPKAIARTAGALQAQADDLGKKAAGSEPHLHALYELAWCSRFLADAEIEAARAKLQSEKAARDPYSRLIAAAPESALANQARIELSELDTRHGDDVAALGLLAEALEKNPAPDFVERVRLRAAALLLARNDANAAWPHVEAVLKNAATPFIGDARYLAGEVFIQRKDWGKAVEQLAVFRDRGEFHNIPGLSDRALLRLGHALAQAGQWDPSRATLDALVQRFPQSPWAEEGRYNLGFALQMMKQFEPAVVQYGELTRRTVSILGAKAQLQIGLCRLEQRNLPEAAKALLTVPYTYDYPELAAQAFCQAGQAYMGMNQAAEAAKLWHRVAQDYPNTEWAKAAQQALAGTK